jgi:hypothetical protein
MGGTLAPYCEALRPSLGHAPWRDYGLVASEGRFTVPIADNTPDGVLDPRVAWYEFTPADGDCGDGGPIIDSRDLIPGESYRLVVTTLGGLYRYDMHDIVQCRGFYVVRFMRKSSHFSNITGEKLCAAQVSEALTKLSQRFEKLAGAARFMTLVADYSCQVPRYALHFEAAHSEQSPEEDLKRFVVAMDEQLAELNCEYSSKRKSGRLGPMISHTLPPGFLDRIMTRHLQRSPEATAEQYKPPVLMDTDRWKAFIG